MLPNTQRDSRARAKVARGTTYENGILWIPSEQPNHKEVSTLLSLFTISLHIPRETDSHLGELIGAGATDVRRSEGGLLSLSPPPHSRSGRAAGRADRYNCRCGRDSRGASESTALRANVVLEHRVCSVKMVEVGETAEKVWSVKTPPGKVPPCPAESKLSSR